MNVGITIWNDRISPVFDGSRRLMTLEVEDNHVTSSQIMELPELDAAAKLRRLTEMNVEVLLCGAIARETESLARSLGIETIPFLAGTVDEITSAYLAGTLSGNPMLHMPGCCGTRNRGAGRCRRSKGMSRNHRGGPR